MRKHDVFVSYSIKDREVARAACAALEAAQVPCWIAPRDVPFGAEYAEALIDAIARCHLVVLVFSSNASQSPHVRREIERAVSKGKDILVFRCEDVPLGPALEYYLGGGQWLEAFAGTRADHLRTLCERVPGMVRLARQRAGTADTLEDRIEQERRQITLEEHDAAVASRPHDPEAWRARAWARFRKQDYRGAIADCDEVLRLDGAAVEMLNLRAMSRFDLGQYPDALRDADDALRTAPDYTMALILKGIIHTNREEYGEAIETLGQAARLRPDWALHHELRASACLNGGQYQDALESCDQAAIAGPAGPASLLLLRAAALKRLGRVDDALRDLDRALELQPGLAKVRRERGRLLVEQHRHEEALRDLDEAVHLAPQDVDSRTLRCLALFFAGRLDAAHQEASHAIALGASVSPLYWIRGRSCLQRDEYDRAIDDLNDAVRLGFEAARIDRGQALLLAGRPQPALADFDRAIDLEPGNADGYALRAAARLMLELDREAVDDLDRAIGIDRTARTCIETVRARGRGSATGTARCRTTRAPKRAQRRRAACADENTARTAAPA
jgi:tetratricopeptide (TPR) repeat protein